MGGGGWVRVGKDAIFEVAALVVIEGCMEIGDERLFVVVVVAKDAKSETDDDNKTSLGFRMIS